MPRTDQLKFDPDRLIHLATIARTARARFRGCRDQFDDARRDLDDAQRDLSLTKSKSADAGRFGPEATEAVARAERRVAAIRARLADLDAELAATNLAAGDAAAVLRAAVEFAAGQGIEIPDAIDMREFT
jgi:chromosome segregation ATPase